MDKFKDKYRVESNRLSNWNYANEVYYFITICTYLKQHFLGSIRNNEISLTDLGNIALECWLKIPNHFPNAQLDEFIIMPNHIHGIIILNNQSSLAKEKNISSPKLSNGSTETQDFVSLQTECNQFQHIVPKSIGSVIRGFKIGVTKWSRNNTNNYTIWQKNYYDRIIRNESELNAIRQYIRYNPMNWNNDEYHVNRNR